MPPLWFEHFCLCAAFFSSVVFLAGYSLLAPWWRYRVGRAVASLDIGLILALAPGTLNYMFGLRIYGAPYLWYACFSLLLVAGITLGRLLVIYRIQRSAQRDPDSNQDPLHEEIS